LNGANKIDELCPPNPNEFDSATFTSHLSFCDPTSKLTSYKIQNLSILDEVEHGKMITPLKKRWNSKFKELLHFLMLMNLQAKGGVALCVWCPFLNLELSFEFRF
jgi:hypothetical protein